MRTLQLILSIALLGTSLAGEKTKLVIHPRDILSVCADDTDVEIVACVQTSTAAPFDPPGIFPPIEFSFPIAPAGHMVKDFFYIRSLVRKSAILTVRLRFKDSRTAAVVTAFIEPQHTGECVPPTPPSADGPYAQLLSR